MSGEDRIAAAVGTWPPDPAIIDVRDKATWATLKEMMGIAGLGERALRYLLAHHRDAIALKVGGKVYFHRRRTMAQLQGDAEFFTLTDAPH